MDLLDDPNNRFIMCSWCAKEFSEHEADGLFDPMEWIYCPECGHKTGDKPTSERTEAWIEKTKHWAKQYMGDSKKIGNQPVGRSGRAST